MRHLRRIGIGLLVVLVLGLAIAPDRVMVVLRAAASFPTSVKSFTTRNTGDTVQAAHVNDLQDEVAAIETSLLGTMTFPLTSSASAPLTLTHASTPEILASVGSLITASNAGVIVQLDKDANGTETFVIKNGAAATVFTVSEAGLVTTLGQVGFPATQSASADVNTLDDYEEGSWTPVIGGSGGTSGQTYGIQVGKYVKWGKRVVVDFHAALTAKGTITTSVQIQGLPFTAENTANYSPVCAILFDALATNWVNVVGLVAPNTTVAGVIGAAAAAVANSTALTTTDIGNTTSLRGTCSYNATN